MAVRHYEEHMESPELLYHLYLPTGPHGEISRTGISPQLLYCSIRGLHQNEIPPSSFWNWPCFLPWLPQITSCCCVHPCDLFPHWCCNAVLFDVPPQCALHIPSLQLFIWAVVHFCHCCCPQCSKRLSALYRMPGQVAVHYKDLQQSSILAIKKNFNLNLGKRLFCFRKLYVTLQLKLLKGALFQLRGFLIILDFKYDCGISSREKQLWTTFCYSYLTFLYMCHIQCVHFKTKWGISVFFRIHSKP